VLASSVERLEGRRLDHLEQLDFATRALALRFPGGAERADWNRPGFWCRGARKTSGTISGAR
jgi:hypothetical protein